MAQQHLKFAIFGNEYQAKKSASIMRILSYLEKREAEVYIESLFYDFLTKVEHLEVQAAGVFEDYNFDVDYVISMGVTVPSSRRRAVWEPRERLSSA